MRRQALGHMRYERASEGPKPFVFLYAGVSYVKSLLRIPELIQFVISSCIHHLVKFAFNGTASSVLVRDLQCLL